MPSSAHSGPHVLTFWHKKRGPESCRVISVLVHVPPRHLLLHILRYLCPIFRTLALCGKIFTPDANLQKHIVTTVGRKHVLPHLVSIVAQFDQNVSNEKSRDGTTCTTCAWMYFTGGRNTLVNRLVYTLSINDFTTLYLVIATGGLPPLFPPCQRAGRLSMCIIRQHGLD